MAKFVQSLELRQAAAQAVAMQEQPPRLSRNPMPLH
jgi:hypothetical protein